MSGPRILIVDDEEEMVELLKMRLMSHGYDVATALNGAAGLKKARSWRPDLLLLDVMMPGIDGYEICRKLRAETATQELPVIILSAKAMEVDVRRGTECGANDYITKPFETKDLLEKVGRYLKG